MSIFSVLMVLVLLSIPTFFYATALEKEIPPQNEQGIIYVGENALVYSNADVSNAIVVNIQVPTTTREIVKPKKNAHRISEQVTIHKISQDQQARKIQAEVTARTTFVYFSQGDLPSVSKSFSNVHSGKLATAITTLKIVGKSDFSPYVIHFFAVRCEKQKFYTSLSFIQSRSIRSSSLRAPPIYLV